MANWRASNSVASHRCDDTNSLRDPLERLERLALTAGDRECFSDPIPLNPAHITAAGTLDIPCRYYEQGSCMFGNRCRFKHGEDSNRGSSTKYRVNNDTHKIKDRPSQPSAPPMPPKLKSITTLKIDIENWVNAPEFIPQSSAASRKSYAQAVSAAASCSDETTELSTESTVPSTLPSNPSEWPLCPYAQAGDCHFGVECQYLHGTECELCGKACMHPYDEEQRKKHTEECIREHERDMEHSFAVARSRDKACGICMEVIMDKDPPGRFGILPSCTHCFCLQCIRTWRQAKNFENKIIRACPECRQVSDYVVPSRFWVETSEDKEKLLEEYRIALTKKNCKYFKQGKGTCPFGNKCFYLHAYPDGTLADVGPPRRKERRNADGETVDYDQDLTLWEFLEEWESRWISLEDSMIVDVLVDSDSSWDTDDDF